MSTPFQFESWADDLRRGLRSSSLAPDTKVLLAARFFSRLNGQSTMSLEPYVREFFPAIVASAALLSPFSFLPRERELICEMIVLAERYQERLRNQSEIEQVKRLTAVADHQAGLFSDTDQSDSVALRCLFVEDHPEFGLAARGKLLVLRASGLVLPKGESDEVIVINPLEQPEDPFIEQARVSIAATRKWLEANAGLESGLRFQFKFQIDTTGARFTGDSLGVAFAVAALVLVSRLITLRVRFTIPSRVSFTGALDTQGTLRSISLAGLKLKIERAYFSGLDRLAIPADHLDEAERYLADLSSSQPGGNLRLTGVASLDAVLGDPSLCRKETVGLPTYLARKGSELLRQRLVEIPILAALLALLFVSIAPSRWMPWYDANPSWFEIHLESNSISLCNAAGDSLWSIVPSCPVNDTGSQSKLVLISNIDQDAKNEVLFMTASGENCPERNRLYGFDSDGETLLVRSCVIADKYPGDSAGVQYDSEHLKVFEVNGEKIIVTNVFASNPARSHMRIWATNGDSIGWYINAGCCNPLLVVDHDRDSREELLAMCYNNRLDRASLLALEPRGAHGCSPPYRDSSLDLTWVEPGNQTAYLAFWYTDVGRVLSPLPYNQPSPAGVRANDSAYLVAFIAEGPWKGVSADLMYYVNRHYRVERVLANDCFSQAESELLRRGERLSGLSFRDYADSVCYWRNGEWMTEGQLRLRDSSTYR